MLHAPTGSRLLSAAKVKRDAKKPAVRARKHCRALPSVHIVAPCRRSRTMLSRRKAHQLV